jgi:hypothetical protein
MPPSPTAPGNYPAQPNNNNVPAIISLITGILGCFVITPFIAIITGFIGIAAAKPPKGGKGMAIAGIILGILWIVGGIGLGVGGYYAGKAGIAMIETMVAEAAKPQTMALFDTLAEGDLAAAQTQGNGLSQSDLETLAAEIKPLGKCTDIDISSPSYSNVNGQVSVSFTGTAKFENGERPINVKATIGQDGQFKFDTLELK